ncbi:MAG: hypothetical protein JWO30_1443 [Fibrobacteres bacterium]|nr:hypothetical protein [Fibrobacterota bacterium]
MSNETLHEVKSAAAVLADDVICQSFIQSSSTLAYACLLIRQKKYDLAVHVLHSLEAKQASRFKDMVFYLQAQIGIETGEFSTVKKRLVPRVNQHPNDLVALSLLECCIHHEWIEWAKTRPQPESIATESGSMQAPDLDSPPVVSDSAFGNAQAASAAAYAAAFGAPIPDPQENNDTPLAGLLEVRSPDPLAAKAAPPLAPAVGIRSAPSSVKPAPAPAGGIPDGDVGIYQTLANDQNTQALIVWNAEKGKLKSAFRNPELEPLVAMLPQEFPASVQDACSALESGAIHKICFSFQNLTVTSFHSGAENMALVTGNINQSLLSIVRAENTFRKQTAKAPASGSASSSAPRPPEYAPNE